MSTDLFKRLYLELSGFNQAEPKNRQSNDKLRLPLLATYLLNLKTKLLLYSPLGDHARDAEIAVVDSIDRTTAARTTLEGAPFIVVEVNLLGFILAMNLTYVYAFSSKRPQAKRTSQVLLNYVTKLRPPYNSGSENYPLPPFPRFKDSRFEIALGVETQIHCTFLLAHELAHIELGHLAGNRRSSQFVRDSGMPLLNWIASYGQDIPLEANLEAEADDLALDLCARVIGSALTTEAEIDYMYLSLYRLSRYFLWLDMVLPKEPEIRSEIQGSSIPNLAWVARHNTLRTSVSRRISAGLVPDELEWLEMHMESGMIHAGLTYRRLCLNQE